MEWTSDGVTYVRGGGGGDGDGQRREGEGEGEGGAARVSIFDRL